VVNREGREIKSVLHFIPSSMPDRNQEPRSIAVDGQVNRQAGDIIKDAGVRAPGLYLL